MPSWRRIKYKDKTNPTNNNKGQVFFEFILLFGAIVLISFVLLRLVRYNVYLRWQAMANKITAPSSRPGDHGLPKLRITN